MKRGRRVIPLLIALIIFTSMSVNASTSYYVVNNQKLQEQDRKIQELLDKRVSLYLKTNPDLGQLIALDNELIKLGVKFLSTEEVAQKFNTVKTGDITAQIDTPVSSNVTWASYRLSNYYYNGKNYNIQRLYAIPNERNSNLKMTITKVVKTNSSWKAGVFAVIKSIAYSGAGAVIGEIPGASLFLSGYDALKSAYSAMSTTTTINVPTINYTTASVTSAAFIYVKLEGQTDERQQLSHVSTKVTTEVSYAIPTFYYTNSLGNVIVHPYIVTGSKTINATPTGYNSISQALVGFVESRQIFANVESIKISGQESTNAIDIHPVYPLSPVYIY